MSDIPDSYPSQVRSITDHVATLRRRIILCILTEGLGRVLLVLVGMLTLDFVIDWNFRLDLPQRTHVFANLAVEFDGCLQQRIRNLLRLQRPVRSRGAIARAGNWRPAGRPLRNLILSVTYHQDS